MISISLIAASSKKLGTGRAAVLGSSRARSRELLLGHHLLGLVAAPAAIGGDQREGAGGGGVIRGSAVAPGVGASARLRVVHRLGSCVVHDRARRAIQG